MYKMADTKESSEEENGHKLPIESWKFELSESGKLELEEGKKRYAAIMKAGFQCKVCVEGGFIEKVEGAALILEGRGSVESPAFQCGHCFKRMLLSQTNYE